MNETTRQSIHNPLPRLFYFLNVNNLLVHSMNVQYFLLVLYDHNQGIENA